MYKNKGFTIVELLIVIAIFGILSSIFVSFTGTGRGAWNNQMYSVQKADDATRYETLKTVEDTCRAMQSSYKADASMVDTYLQSGNMEWAQQVAIRANRTAATYNEYILKNSFIWKGAVPPDIASELKTIKVSAPTPEK